MSAIYTIPQSMVPNIPLRDGDVVRGQVVGNQLQLEIASAVEAKTTADRWYGRFHLAPDALLGDDRLQAILER